MEVSTDPDSANSPNHLCIICNREYHEKQKNPPEDNWKEFEENAKAWKEINGVFGNVYQNVN